MSYPIIWLLLLKVVPTSVKISIAVGWLNTSKWQIWVLWIDMRMITFHVTFTAASARIVKTVSDVNYLRRKFKEAQKLKQRNETKQRKSVKGKYTLCTSNKFRFGDTLLYFTPLPLKFCRHQYYTYYLAKVCSQIFVM